MGFPTTKQSQKKGIAVAFGSPAESLTFSGLMDNPVVGKKFKSQHPSNMHQSSVFDLSGVSVPSKPEHTPATDWAPGKSQIRKRGAWAPCLVLQQLRLRRPFADQKVGVLFRQKLLEILHDFPCLVDVGRGT